MSVPPNLGIQDNGWKITYTPDFIECLHDDKVMSRIYPNPNVARKRIIKAISDLCKSASPGSRKYPRKGRIKWFKGAGKIRELDLPNKNYDARLLWSCRHEEISLIAITDHKGMIKISRSATARVHSTPIDDYDLSDTNVLQVIELENKENSDTDIAAKEASLDREIEIANEVDGFVDENFEDLLSRITVWENTTHGQEIKLTEEQHKAVNHPTPMLLPGVAGTGKSTVLQKRFRNDLEKWVSKSNNSKSDQKQPSHMIYLTVNPNLAAHTIEEMRGHLPDWINLEELVMSLESWLKETIAIAEPTSDPEKRYPIGKKIDFYYFRNWFKGQPSIRSNFDPAQLWEEYRGVLRGSEKSLGDFLPKKEYLDLAKNRGVFEKSERSKIYPILKNFEKSLHSEDWLDQELASHVLGLELTKKISHIYVDEVQDLTELQTRVLISRLPEEKSEFGAFDLTGDVSQQVYPSGFRWEDIGKMLHKIRGMNITPSPPLNINYRSGKNLIDLANWTLSEMDERNRISSGAELQQAYAANDGAMPSIFVESEAQLIDRMVKSGLPKADSPVIVRDEKKVFEIKKQIDKTKDNLGQFTEGGSRSEFVFTVAQAKGLEFSHVILWDIGRGSNNLLKRAYHLKKGEYLEEEEWNIQLELRHLFVGITRSRVLLLLLTQNDTPEFKDLGGNPLDQTLLSEGVLAKGDDDDFTRLAETSMNAEELLKMAESYANQGMFDAAYAAAQEAGNEESATRYKQKHLEQNLEYYAAAKIARQRGENLEASKLAEEAVNTSSENVDAAVLLEELYDLLGEEVKASEMKAKRYYRTAQKTKAKNQAKMLFSLAAEEWGTIGNFSDSAVAWSKAKNHIESAIAYQKIEDYFRLREEVVSFIKKNHGKSKQSIRVAIIYLLGDKATKIASNWDLNSHLRKVSTRLHEIDAKQEISADLQQALRFAESKYGDKELAKKIQALDLEDISNPEIRARRLLQLGRKKDAAKIYYENGNFKEAFDTFVIDDDVDEKGQVQLLKNEEFEGIEPRIKLANWWYEYLKSTDKEGAYNKALEICSQNAPTNLRQIRNEVNRISKKENSSTLEERMILSKLLSRFLPPLKKG